MSATGIWRSGALAGVLLLAGPAFAQGPLATDTPFTLQVDASHYYPDRAQRMEVAGWARLRCVAHEDAKLSDCVLVGEGPSGYGFGRALMMLSRSMRVRPDVLPEVVGKPSYYRIGFRPDGPGRVPLEAIKPPKPKLIEAARPAGADQIGMATVSCLVPLTAISPLSACVALGEGPTGQGFGAAAVDLAQRAYVANFEPTPARVDLWFGAPMVKTMDGRRLVEAYGSANTALIVAPTASAESLAAMPEQAVKMNCGWSPDGALQDCTVDPTLATTFPDAVKTVLAFTPNLRLVRTATFNILWGQ
jgi:hypothetical protein